MITCAKCKHKLVPGYNYPCCKCDSLTHNKYEAVESHTEADRIRSMNDEDLAKFLKSIAFGRETPWAGPFARNFCDKCLPIKAIAEETGKEIEFHECECWDGNCPNGDDVTWWLKQPVEEVKE